MGKPRSLRVIEGVPIKPLTFYKEDEAFAGQFDLLDERDWPDLVQTGVLNLSANPDANVGGCDYLKLTANGSAINVPAEWKNIGSESISATAGHINRIIVRKTPSEIVYSVKVEIP